MTPMWVRRGGRGLRSRAGAALFSARETPARHRAAPRGARPVAKAYAPPT